MGGLAALSRIPGAPHTPAHTSKAPCPAKDVVIPGFLRVPARMFHWMVGTSWGEGRGNTLIPPTAHPKMRPRRDFSSQREESHQSHLLAVFFAPSRWHGFLSLCLYYVVVCGFIRDWVGIAQNRTRVIVYITSAQIVGYSCLLLLSSRCFPESLSSMMASSRGCCGHCPAAFPDAWQDGLSCPQASFIPSDFFCGAQRPEQRKPRETPR